MKRMNINAVRKIADQEADKKVGAHEKKMHKAKKMGRGGPTGMDMRNVGRNMARVLNQRGS